MSDQHTPTLDDLRAGFLDMYADEALGRAEFDRAIAKVRAEAKQEALLEAATELEQLDEIDGKGSYRAGPDNCANWLRARADKLVTP